MSKGNDVIKSIFGAAVIMLLTFLISLFSASYEFTKPIRIGFLGFDIYDLLYQRKGAEPLKIDTNIVMVEVGDDRKEIIDQLEIIVKHQPIAIGLDAFFEEPRDKNTDKRLEEILLKNKNIVLANRNTLSESGVIYGIPNIFSNASNLTGYATFLGRDSFTVIRSFYPFYKSNDHQYKSFAAVVASVSNPSSYEVLLSRNNKEELINYTGNLSSFIALNKKELKEYDAQNKLAAILSNKIVLIGYFSTSALTVLQDLYFTPLNSRISGKSYPDMYGVVIHANIISMILNRDYITLVSTVKAYLIAYFLCFTAIFIMLRQKHPNHVKLLFFLLILNCLIILLFVFLFALTGIKTPLAPIIIGLVLSIEFFDMFKYTDRLLQSPRLKKFSFNN